MSSKEEKTSEEIFYDEWAKLLGNAVYDPATGEFVAPMEEFYEVMNEAIKNPVVLEKVKAIKERLSIFFAEQSEKANSHKEKKDKIKNACDDAFVEAPAEL